MTKSRVYQKAADHDHMLKHEASLSLETVPQEIRERLERERSEREIWEWDLRERERSERERERDLREREGERFERERENLREILERERFERERENERFEREREREIWERERERNLSERERGRDRERERDSWHFWEIFLLGDEGCLRDVERFFEILSEFGVRVSEGGSKSFKLTLSLSLYVHPSPCRTTLDHGSWSHLEASFKRETKG